MLIPVVVVLILVMILTVNMHVLLNLLHVGLGLLHTLAGIMESGVVFSCVVVLVAVGFNWHVVNAGFNFAVLPSAGNLLSVTCLETMPPRAMKRPHK